MPKQQRKQRRSIYIALESMNFYWSTKELSTTIDLWNDGCSIPFISKEIKRSADEIGLLIISVSLRYKIFFQRDYDALKNTNSVTEQSPGYKVNVRRFIQNFKNGYLLFEGSAIDFIWDEDQVIAFRSYWNKGIHINEIKKQFKRRTNLDIVALAVDQCQKGFVLPRKNGLEGVIDGYDAKCGSKPKENTIA